MVSLDKKEDEAIAAIKVIFNEILEKFKKLKIRSKNKLQTKSNGQDSWPQSISPGST